MSPDVDASKAFYSNVFGWHADDQHDDQGNRIYVMFDQDGKTVAGLGGQAPGMEGMPPMWNTYVAVDDVAAVVERASAAGGSVVAPPMQVMDAGDMAVIADPAGAVISVWKANRHIGAEICNEPDTWSWNELLTRDLDTAIGFYTKVFDWDLEAQDMGPMGIYHVVRGGASGSVAGLMAMPPGVPDMVPDHWVVYFAVADLDATLGTITGDGGSITQQPFDVPDVGRIASAHDPAGGSFSLMQIAS
jgi:predicted enzyme related to lactoylglutathione lyase